MNGFDVISPSSSLLLLLLLLSLGFSAVVCQRALKKEGGRQGQEKRRETVKLYIYITRRTQGETHKSQDASWEIQSLTQQTAHFQKYQESITSKYLNISEGKLRISPIFLKPNLEFWQQRAFPTTWTIQYFQYFSARQQLTAHCHGVLL